MKYNKENKTAARTRYYKFREAAKGMDGKQYPSTKQRSGCVRANTTRRA